MILFVGSDCGRVFIGYAKNPQERIATIQSFSPRTVKLSATVEGTVRTEMALRSYFSDCQTHLGWFTPSDELLELIGHAFRHGKLPLWLKLPDDAHMQRQALTFTSMKVTKPFRDWIKRESATLQIPMYEVIERKFEQAFGRPWDA
jgi:hypothetical protein